MTNATKSSIARDAIVLERTDRASPDRVFHAWEDVEAHKRWSKPWQEIDLVYDSHDFRVGGTDTYRCGFSGKPMSHSLSTFEFFPDGKGCRLVFTEQGVYFGGEDDVKNRKAGFLELIGKLEAEIESRP